MNKKCNKYLKIINIILKILIISILIISFFLAFKYRKFIKRGQFGYLIKLISSHGEYSAVVFILIYAIKPLVIFIPSSVMSIIGGTLFGPINGFLLNMLGFFLSGTLAFYLARYLGKSFVDKILRGKAMNMDCNMKKNGFKIIFLFRFPPIFHYDIFSYAAGLTKVKYIDFILGSLLGVVPETLCYSYMGKSIMKPHSGKFIIPVIIIILTTIIGTYVFKSCKMEKNLKNAK